MSLHVVCGHCDSVVGLPADRLKDAPRCPSCHFALFEGKPVNLTAANFDKHIARSGLPLVVDGAPERKWRADSGRKGQVLRNTSTKRSVLPRAGPLKLI
jgi:hypothetical protein